ncbi:MAG: hypothetical protein ACXWG5_10500 [Candidatus Aminicenantales bacterium]
MEKGFLRRLSEPLVGAFLLACLSGTPAGPAGPPGAVLATGSSLWEVHLTVEAKGDYRIGGAGAPIAGEYACRLRWEGRLEPDEDDFLLVHLKTEVLEWRLRETAGSAGRETTLEAPAAPTPFLRMNYVLKDGREVEFFFELGGISIPLHPLPHALALELPRSSGRTPGGPGQAYGNFVCRGSSRVAIPEADLTRRKPERHFSWEWRKERQYVRDGRVLTVVQSHAAEAVVTLTAR